MKTHFLLACVIVLGMCSAGPVRGDENKPDGKPPTTAPAAPPASADATTDDTVTVGKTRIDYRAVAGTLTVGSSDDEDAKIGLDGKRLPDLEEKPPEKPEDAPATSRMFYTAYFKKDASAENRPVTFLYNGGPRSMITCGVC